MNEFRKARYWKLGFIYYNKEDSRLFVSKRIKWMGWTLNFAHPASYILIVLLIIFILYSSHRTP